MKEKEPVNEFAEHIKKWTELRDSVKNKIEEILNSEGFNRPAHLAEAYLDDNKTCPIPRLRNLENAMKRCMNRAAKEIKPQALKPIKDDFFKFWRGIYEEMKGRIAVDTLKELERNYGGDTVDKVVRALVDFDAFSKRENDIVKVVDDDSKKAFTYFKNKHENVINATDFLLKSPGLLDSEKEVLQGIRARHIAHFIRLSQYKKIELDPIKAALLNRAARPSLLGNTNPEAWIEEFFQQCREDTLFIKPPGRPKKIIFNALVIVIYSLIEAGKNSERKKTLQNLTADIVNQCFGLKDKLTSKKIENILHST